MLTVRRHDTVLSFDDEGFTETPWVYRPLSEDKVYEERFLDYIRALGRRGVYLDVGAHLGTHTVWFAALCESTHVHAFEPVSRFADVLRRNVAANGLEDKVTVHRLGLGASAGVARSQLSAEHQMGFVDGQAAAAEEEFDVKRLDSVVGGAHGAGAHGAGAHGPVAVIKLDVEGMEPAVLQGASRILSRDRPMVFAEAHSRRPRRRPLWCSPGTATSPPGASSTPRPPTSTPPLPGWAGSGGVRSGVICPVVSSLLPVHFRSLS